MSKGQFDRSAKIVDPLIEAMSANDRMALDEKTFRRIGPVQRLAPLLVDVEQFQDALGLLQGAAQPAGNSIEQFLPLFFPLQVGGAAAPGAVRQVVGQEGRRRSRS